MADCRITPQTFSMGVKAIYLVRCQNASGESAACGKDTTVAEKMALYDGDLVPLTITQEGMAFPQPINSLSADFDAGGIQMVFGYLEQRWHDAETNPFQAGRVTPSLQGAAYRRCTVRRVLAGEERMENECGHPDAMFGDYLFEIDGVWGFLDVRHLSADGAGITQDRADTYSHHFLSESLRHLSGLKDFLGVENEITDEGYFAPVYGLREVRALSAQSGYDFTMDFNITAVTHFFDGASLKNENFSLGVYHPYEDLLPTMMAPRSRITVVEKSE